TKAARGLGVDVKGSTISGTKLVKIYSGAGRMIVLVYVKKGYYLPVLVRLKKDKIVGTNLGKGNKDFQELLNKNLNLVEKDLNEGNFEEL
ncbi:MAG: hypothetical protein GWP15_01885, partial [Nitrospirae bacterium]|nr:hypothetical protein [Nitrospirota bacterium]